MEFHTEVLQTSRATVLNLVIRVTRRPGYMHPRCTVHQRRNSKIISFATTSKSSLTTWRCNFLPTITCCGRARTYTVGPRSSGWSESIFIRCAQPRTCSKFKQILTSTNHNAIECSAFWMPSYNWQRAGLHNGWIWEEEMHDTNGNGTV